MIKPLFLRLSPTRLKIIYQAYHTNLDINILKDFFVDAKDLDIYLSTDQNYKAIIESDLLRTFVNFGDRHKAILVEHYEKNKDRLKLLLRAFPPTKICFVFQSYNTHLHTNIAKDIFEDTQDLDNYLNARQNYKGLIYNRFLTPVINLSYGQRMILIKHYEKNKDRLKPLLRAFSPTRLVYIYVIYKNHLNINIVKDIFTDLNALDDYLKKHDVRLFQQDDVLRAIQRLGYEHKQLLNQYDAFGHFFYRTRTTKNGF